MRNWNPIRFMFIIALVAGTFLALWAAKPVKEDTPCKESMEECCKKAQDDNTDKMSWETLPHRFFSSL